MLHRSKCVFFNIYIFMYFFSIINEVSMCLNGQIRGNMKCTHSLFTYTTVIVAEIKRTLVH